MCSQLKTVSVEDACNELARVCTGLDVDMDCVDEHATIIDENSETDTGPCAEVDLMFGHNMTTGSLRQQSPFTTEFTNAICDNISDTDSSIIENDMKNTSAFKVFERLTNLYPLWSAVLHADVQRLAKDTKQLNQQCYYEANAELQV